MSGEQRGILFALAAMAFFSAQDGISTYLANLYPVPWFVAIRYWLFAFYVLALFGVSPGGVRAAAATRTPVLQISRGVLLIVQILVIVTSFGLIGLAATHAIVAMHPLVATILAVPILGEKVGWRRIGAVLVGFAGVLIIIRPGASVFDPLALVAVLAAVMMGSYSVLTRLANRRDGNPRASFFWTAIGGAAAITLIGPFFYAPMTWGDLGLTVVLSLTGMTGHYCLIRALDETEAVRIQPLVYVQVVMAILLGWLVFGETIDTATLAGVALICSAGLYAIWREARLSSKASVAREGEDAPPA